MQHLITSFYKLGHTDNPDIKTICTLPSTLTPPKICLGMLIVQADLFATSHSLVMDMGREKKMKICLKISKLEKQLKYLRSGKSDSPSDRAIAGGIRKKKRTLQARVNYGQIHPAIKKVTGYKMLHNIMFQIRLYLVSNAYIIIDIFLVHTN